MVDERFLHFMLSHGDYETFQTDITVQYDTHTKKWSRLNTLGQWIPLGLDYFTDPDVRLYRYGTWVTMADVENGDLPPF